MTIRTVSACFLYMQIFLTYLYNFFWEMLLAMRYGISSVVLCLPLAVHGLEVAQDGISMRQETNPLALLSSDEPNRLG